MNKFRPWIWILLFGSLWGMSEVFGGEALYSADIPMASVWLSIWALAILAFARTLQNTPGTSSAIGLIAALFRLVNAGPFICHILAIIMLGVGFDLAASALIRNSEKSIWKRGLTGIIGAYGGFALFALIITYIVRYDMWVSGGWSKIADHIFVSGSLTAAAASFIVPLAFWLGRKEITSRVLSSRLAYSGAMAVTFLLWILGRLAA